MSIAYIDGRSGAAGDMLLAALLDAGWPESALRQLLQQFPVDGWKLVVERTVTHGMAATRLRFDVAQTQPLRHLSELTNLIAGARLQETVRGRVVSVLQRLAEAEAQVHGVAVEDVHFHEVGAVDTLFDVAGVVAGLDFFGVREVHVAPLNVGGGVMKMAHGTVPVPPPAVALLCRSLVTYGTPDVGELLTPTAAALLSTLGNTARAQPAMQVAAVGTGAGTKQLPFANTVRVMVGESAHLGANTGVEVVEELCELACNLDNLNPEVLAYATDQVLAAGALDAWVSPMVMKKGRSGQTLHVLCAVDAADRLRDVLFRQTSTLGVRQHLVRRDRLARSWQTVTTAYGPIRIKEGVLRGEVVNRAPEYEDCVTAAQAHNVPLKVVYEMALRGIPDLAGSA